MRVLLVHPSALMYSEIFLRLEPLGLERVAAALLADGHEVRLTDLQVYSRADLARQVTEFRPRAVGFSLNYLANVPEVVELAQWLKTVLPDCLVFAGGHSVSFVAEQVLAHAEGAIDVVLKGEGETGAPALLAAAPDRALKEVPGAVTPDGPGRPPRLLHSLNDHLPARHLGGRRRKYFIGVMDPAASIEFTRGCPWDCSFCSAWTFYGRSYRRLSPEAAVEDMARIAEPGVFIVDDVAFIKAEDGDEIARQLEHRKIRKQYYLETRCDVLLRNEEVFRRWRRLGLNYMFLGLEALDEEGLKAFRKRTTPKVNNQALEVARSHQGQRANLKFPKVKHMVAGVVATTAGVAGFLAIGQPSGGRTQVSFRILPLLAIGIVVVTGGCLAVAARNRNLRPLALALACGVNYGVAAFLIKLLTSEFGGGPGQVFTNWPIYFFAVVGPAGYILNQDAFQQGTLLAPVQAIISAADPVISIALGIVWLAVRLRGSPADIAGEVVSLLLLTGGIFMTAYHVPSDLPARPSRLRPG